MQKPPERNRRSSPRRRPGRSARISPPRTTTGATHQWIPRPSKDDPEAYEVVKVALPPPLDNLGTEVRADERPETPDDPRTAQDRNIGPWVGGG